MTLKSVDPIAHRRDPSQRRALVLIDAIRQAALEIIEKEGPAALTTNRVADRAGVSIGSLYHYYPNKESIVADLFEVRVQALVDAIEAMRQSVHFEDLPLPDALRAYLELALAHRERLAHLHREFLHDFGARFEVPSRTAPDGRTYHEITVEWLCALLGAQSRPHRSRGLRRRRANADPADRGHRTRGGGRAPPHGAERPGRRRRHPRPARLPALSRLTCTAAAGGARIESPRSLRFKPWCARRPPGARRL